MIRARIFLLRLLRNDSLAAPPSQLSSRYVLLRGPKMQWLFLQGHWTTVDHRVESRHRSRVSLVRRLRQTTMVSPRHSIISRVSRFVHFLLHRLPQGGCLCARWLMKLGLHKIRKKERATRSGSFYYKSTNKAMHAWSVNKDTRGQFPEVSKTGGNNDRWINLRRLLGPHSQQTRSSQRVYRTRRRNKFRSSLETTAVFWELYLIFG